MSDRSMTPEQRAAEMVQRFGKSLKNPQYGANNPFRILEADIAAAITEAVGAERKRLTNNFGLADALIDAADRMERLRTEAAALQPSAAVKDSFGPSLLLALNNLETHLWSCGTPKAKALPDWYEDWHTAVSLVRQELGL